MRDANDLARAAGVATHADWVRRQARRKRISYRPAPRGTVQARLEGDRWLADCPFCAGAELVTADGIFFCFSCRMEHNDGHPMTVVGGA